MVQGLPAKVPARAGVWVEDKVKAEAGWADHLPQGREEVVYAPTAGNWCHILSGSPVIKRPALNAAR